MWLLVTLYTLSCGTFYSLCPFLPWQVKAEEGKERLETPEASIRAERYQSASPNYLSISIPHTVVAPGDTLPITLNDIHQPGRGNIGYFYYMVNRIVSVISFRNYATWNIYLVTKGKPRGSSKGQVGWLVFWYSWPTKTAEGTGLVQLGEEPKGELIATWNYLKRN